VIPERIKALVLPVAALVALEIWTRVVHLQSDSLAPPSAIAVALASALGDGAILNATRDTELALWEADLYWDDIFSAKSKPSAFDEVLAGLVTALIPIAAALAGRAGGGAGFGDRVSVSEQQLVQRQHRRCRFGSGNLTQTRHGYSSTGGGTAR